LAAEGDNWGGIESHLVSLAPSLIETGRVDLECLLFSEGQLREALDNMGVKTWVIAKSGIHAVWREIRNLLAHRKYDIVHMHSLVVAFYILTGTRLMNDCKFIWTVHGKPEKVRGVRWVKDKIARKTVYWIMKHSKHTRFVCVSNDQMNWLSRTFKVPTEKIGVVRNGFARSREPRYESVLDEYGFGPDDPIILMLGRLVEIKGHIYALSAIKIAVDNGLRNIRLLIAGDGPLRNELATYCRKVGIHGNVIFLGHRADACRLIRAAHIFMITSLDEGIPYSLLEAMDGGKPVIATAVGGIPEVVQDRVNGLLVPPRCSDDIARAIALLCRDREAREILARQAEMTVRTHFSAIAMAEKTVELYDTMQTGNEYA